MKFENYDYRAMTARAIVLALISKTPSVFDRQIAIRAVELTDMLINELDTAISRREQTKRDNLANEHQDEVDEKHPVVNGMQRANQPTDD